jgi:L-ascorbate metabolism protein UlaG (beta-lactamase superfamily)
MIITYHGAGCFRLSVGNTNVLLGPIGKESEWKSSNLSSDISISPLFHEDTYAENKNGIVFSGPGEYEASDILIKGYSAKTKYKEGKERYTTLYLIKMEKMTLLYLGPLSEKVLPNALKEVLDDVDILFIPIDGGEEHVLDISSAQSIAVSVEPHLIIPFCYNKKNAKETMRAFTKEMGSEVFSVKDKYVIKPNALESNNQNCVFFE